MSQTPPEQQPTSPTSAPPPAPATPPAPPETGQQPPWGDNPENFNAEKAWELIQNLRKEKGAPAPDPQLRSELDTLKTQQTQQRDALARALGIAPDETSDADKLAKQVAELQEQFSASRTEATRLTVAQNNGIPPEFQGWLTESDPERLDQQAKALLPMVQATLAARGQAPLMPAVPGAPAAPAFQPNPGQGQPLPPPGQGGFESYYDENGRPRF